MRRCGRSPRGQDQSYPTCGTPTKACTSSYATVLDGNRPRRRRGPEVRDGGAVTLRFDGSAPSQEQTRTAAPNRCAVPAVPHPGGKTSWVCTTDCAFTAVRRPRCPL